MAKKIESNRSESIPAFPQPPIFFADQPAALMLGPYVSRISFGVEEIDDGDFPRPVVTVAMPTVALLQFVNDVKRALDSADFKKQTIEQLSKAAETIAQGGMSDVGIVEEAKPVAKRRVRKLK